MNEFEIVITDGGSILHLYDDALRDLIEGKITIQRASHVEPTADGRWTADMSPAFPMSGPVLGPFETRAEALAAEREYLNARLTEVRIDR